MRSKEYIQLLCAGAAALAMIPGLAYAQEAAADQSKAKADGQSEVKSEEIVVTGTLIRGSVPIGSNAIALDEKKTEAVAPISTNELLASVPQVTNYFNKVPLADLGGAGAVNQIQISRPNLRNISSNNAASAATLIIVDGHRVASAGVNQASVDPDLIPLGAIERVEIVTEGGSATYGADAVAGVINFITRKRFDGLEVNGHYGFADDYWQWDAGVTAGKDWGSGSAYVSYTYSKSDALYGRDRDFIHNLDYTKQPYVGLDKACPNSNVTISGVNYAAPNFAPNTVNACDNSQNSTYIPEAERHGVLAALNQDLDDKTNISVRAYYSRRETVSRGDYSAVVAVGANNPYVPSNLPLVSPTRASVNFNLSPLLGDAAQTASTLIEEWGANAEISHEITDNWQIRGLFNSSSSNSSYHLGQISPSRLAAAGLASTPETAINPFDVTNNDAALISDLTDSEIAGQAKDNLLDLRLIAEGRLFDLPGGAARLAFGYEFMNDSLSQRFRSDVRVGGLSSVPFTDYGRHVHSVFGELQLPLIADRQGGSMLTLSGSGRYDHYSDFGGTFNPKISAAFIPAHWLTVRGNWGTSFTAPTPLDQLGSLRNTVSSFPFVPFRKPGEAVPPNSFTLALQGSVPGLKPQTADTWSVGFDVKPLDGLRASVNYYSVDFKNIIATPKVDSNIVTNYPDKILTNPNGFSTAELLAFGAQAPGGIAVVAPLIASGALVYELVDFRVANFQAVKVTGLDFNLNYQHPTGFGGVDFSVNGNVPLTRKTKLSPTSGTVDELATDNPRLFLQTALGADIDAFRAQVSWNLTGGYDIPPTNSVPVQNHVSPFNTVDLFFKYDVTGESAIMKNLSFTLNVKNVFDQDPPVLLRSFTTDRGFANGFTFGRMFILGAQKKF
jgi:iron complex outermembrane receptor protein